MKRLLGVITLILCAHILFAQPPITESQARAELQKLGIEEDVMRKKLLERGIDIDKVDQNDPARLLEVQKAIEEVIAEIEAEKAAGGNSPATGGNTTAPSSSPPAAPPPNPNPEPVPEQVIVDSTEAAIQEIKKVDQEVIVSEELIEEFQEELPPSVIYGQHIFRDKSIKLYRQSEDIKPPDTYVLGVGDIIAVSIWGVSQEGGVYEINKSGYISPTQMPRIYLKGIALGKAKELLMRRFSNYYRFRPEEFEVTVNYSRTITVNMVGEVINYGSYTIPAINTAFNALVAAGGPSDIGSVRNIRLLRANGKSKRVDIYEYLLDPSVQNEYYLQENDYIHVPIAERLITISGAVNRAFTFELTDGEQLKELIEFAGGFKVNAYKNQLQVKRFVNDEEKIIDVDFTQYADSEADFELLNGDVITVKSIARPYKNFVEISGAVEFPGRFELTDGMRISELIEKAQFLEEARRDVAFIQRSNIDGTVRFEKLELDQLLADPTIAENLALQPKDKVLIYSLPDFVDKAEFSISGAVRKPVQLPYSVGEEIRIDDAIILAGGLLPDATDFGYIRRMDPINKKLRETIRVNIKEALENPNSAANLTIEPFDQLIIYSSNTYTDDLGSISVSGSVRNPIETPFAENTTISDMITMAGGLTIDATSFGYLKRIDPRDPKFRETIRVNIQQAMEDTTSAANLTLRPFDQLTIYSIRTYTDDANLSVTGSVRNPIEMPFADSTRVKDMIDMAGGLTSDAANFAYIRRVDPTNSKNRSIVRVDLQAAFESPSSEANVILEPFDVLTTYSKELFTDDASINITGAVRQPGTFPFANNFTLKDILTLAGGLKLGASQSRIEIFRLVFKESDDEPIETIVATVEIDDSLNVISSSGDFDLAPFDLVVVRQIPEFELQNVVTINGEVKYPGAYPLIDDNERITSIIQRAGGITDEAFPEGATLFRSEDNVGYIVVEFGKVIRNNRERTNFILKEGDIIDIPKQKDLVTIEGATKANELYPDRVVAGGKINVAYRKGKSAKWYVDHYAAGIGDNGQAKRITVVHPNGEIERTKNFLFFKDFPSVREGSIVTVGVKPPKPEKDKGPGEEREKVNWGQTLADGLAQATAVLSLILLVQQINR